ncbi:hypothetical protein FXV77_01905 [Sphingobacterium phlebotomi]|uniref:Substrate import-associated zinc metallohydrolase lipoprotein n=1 Tax=Sphingobacterium phlebotomi TaxID=2605433 RepID=A0A5D4HBM3_9SPHI|nr:substrate import-associated zinc metallohydrolase lipoprotein [Sphingobacterium phlebotomi]TYR38058.1 hypothetical protein FXV77_01905 [Sphingobacterium phlebotomi]
MNKIFILYIIGFFVVSACTRDNDNLDVDMDSYNTDQIVPNEIDKWIMSNLTNPYNIEVIYRYSRNLADVSKDIAPAKLDKVQPMMEAVLRLYLEPYERVAGAKFIKTFTPKQYVLYGSVSYNSNGSVTLGTADGGRKVTLFDVNNFRKEEVDGDRGVRRKLRTIHHEFTHILNQNVIILPEFAEVTKADYYSDWTNAANTAELAKSMGFVSRYARMVYTEDFAEMVAHLLVEGQVWFDNYVMSAPQSAQAKLRRKEELVVQYFKDAFDIDFRVLQNEVQESFKNLYNAQDPADLTQTLGAWLMDDKISSIIYTPGASHYTEYGISTTFSNLWKTFYDAVATQTPTGNRRYLKNMELQFTSSTTMMLQFGYSSSATDPAIGFYAAYNFTFEIDPATSEIKFSKVLPEPTGGSHGNGSHARFKPYFEQYMLPYFTNRVFVADWLPSSIAEDDPLYRTFGGFYEKENPSNYFYGPVELK